MENLKRWLAALLALSLLTLCGCVEQPAQTTGDPSGTTAAEPSDPTDPTEAQISFPPANPLPQDLSEKTLHVQAISDCYEVTKTLLPETLDNPEGLPVLKWVILGACTTGEMQCFTPFDKDIQWSDQAALELNAMLSQYGLPFQIQFTIFSTRRQQEMDWFRLPEVCKAVAAADLVTGPMDARDMVKYLTPLTEHIRGTGEPKLSAVVPHEYAWLQTTVEGEIYAVPGYASAAVTGSWRVRDEVFTELGISAEAFQQADPDALLAEIYGKNGTQPFLGNINNGLSSSWYQGVKYLMPSGMHSVLSVRYQLIGSCFAIDYSGEKPVVVNYLETDYFRRIQEKMLAYFVEGYYGSDDTNMKLSYGYGYLDTDYSYWESAYGSWKEGTIRQIPVGQLHYEVDSGTTYATGICKNSGKQALAMALLEKVGSDESFLTMLCYGVEGKDYVLRNGVYEPLDRKDGTYSMDFLFGLAALVDFNVNDNEIAYPKKEGMTRLETYRESLDNAQVWVPAAFNWVYMDSAVGDINGILESYFPSFPFISENTYEKLLTRLRAAGSDAIRAELQRQLDYWLETNPEYASMLHN